MRRSTVVICAGALLLLAGATITLAPWLEVYRWQASPEAVQAERNAAAPQVQPVRPTSTRVPRGENAPPVAAARPTELFGAFDARASRRAANAGSSRWRCGVGIGTRSRTGYWPNSSAASAPPPPEQRCISVPRPAAAGRDGGAEHGH